MRTINEIKEAIRQISSDDRAALRVWLAELDAAEWDRQIDSDVAAGRLDWIVEEARQYLKSGRFTDRCAIAQHADSGLVSMNCRHCKAEWTTVWEYCPECKRNYGGAVYPATQTPEEIADIAALVEVIHQAFTGNQLEDGTTIHEAYLEGAYSDDQVRLDARAKDLEIDWKDVADWKIERFHAALSFFDRKAWRFYIPAYMCWTLKNWRSSRSQTVDSVIWEFEPFNNSSVDRYHTLSDEQGAAVFKFLDFFRRYSGEPDANRAIEAYWYRFQDVASQSRAMR